MSHLKKPEGQGGQDAYDAEGNRTSLQAPSGTTSFGFDAIGRIANILDPQGGITAYTYDAAGNPASLTQPNGVQTVYGRDQRDRLTTIESRTSGGSLLARYAYTLDLAGNRTRLDEASGRAVSWQYDALSRLLSETIEQPSQPAETEAFGYDAVGNRIFRATASGIETSLYDANDRLLSDGTAVYTWDPNGNLQSKTDATGTTQYRFDGAGDLAASRARHSAASFVYGASHDLLEIVDRLGVRGAQTEYDAAGRLVAVIDADVRHARKRAAASRAVPRGRTTVGRVASAGLLRWE